MPDIRELGRRVKAKYPEYGDLSDEEVGRRVKAKYPEYSDFTDVAPTPAAPPAQQPEGMLSSFQTGIAGPLLRNVLNTAADLYNRPGETLERAGRSALEFISAFDPAGNAYPAEVAIQEPKLAELRARAAAERPEVLKSMEVGMRQEEAKPRTRAGKVAGAVGSVLGEVAFPTAPENLAGNVIMAPFAGAAVKTVGKVAAPILRRIRGGAAAAEAATPATEAAIQTPAGAVKVEGPGAQVLAEEIGGSATPTVQRAMDRFQQAVQDIKAANLPPAQEAQAMEAAIQSIGREASGVRPVSPQSRAGYPPLMEFPENPNPQQAPGFLPGEGQAAMSGPSATAAMEAGPPRLSAQVAPERFGVSAGQDYTETVGPRVGETMGFETKPPATPSAPTAPPEFTGAEPFKRPPAQQALFGRRAAPAERTPLIQTIGSLLKAGMLTRPTTHLKNLGGNAGFQISEELARIPGAIIDAVVSPITKQRALTGPNLRAMGRSAYEAATKGVDDAVRILKTGRTPTEIEGLQEIAGRNPILQTYVNGVFRMLKAEDAVFKSYAVKRALEDRVRSAVLTKIRKGEIPRSGYQAQFNETMKFPPSDIVNGAILDAEVATFNNPNITGSLRTGISGALERFGQKFPAAKGATQAADFAIDRIVPFAKTPANVIARMFEYMGLGYGKSAAIAARSLLKRSMSPAEQRAFSQSFGRASVGSGLLALGYIGYRDGWLTGLQEDEGSKRARDVAAGRVPGAILVGKTWRQITGISPIGNIMAIGATLARETEQEQTGGYLKQAGKAAKVVGQAALEQPLLSGTKQLIEGVEQPGNAGARYLGGLAGSVVPGIVSDVGQAIDANQRQAQTLGARVMERIPGVRQTLPVRQDVTGQAIPAPNPLNPMKSATAQQLDNPLFAELVRLDTGINGFQKKPDESDDAYRTRVQAFGDIYTRFGQQLVESPIYQKADDTTREAAIKLLNERAKELVSRNLQRIAAGPLAPGVLIANAKGQQIRKSVQEKIKAKASTAKGNAPR